MPLSLSRTAERCTFKKEPPAFGAMAASTQVWRDLRNRGLFLDCAFRYRSKILCSAHRIVLGKASRFWAEYFGRTLRRTEIDIPFDLQMQFATVIDFCYDPTIQLPANPSDLFALFFVATVYQVNGLVDRAFEAFPDPTFPLALQFLDAERWTEQAKIPRRAFLEFSALEHGLELARSQVDKVLPFIVDILPVVPADGLCEAVTLHALMKIAEFEPEGEPNPVHAAITRFVSTHGLPDEHHRLPRRELLSDALFTDPWPRAEMQREEERESDELTSAMRFVVPIPEPRSREPAPIDSSPIVRRDDSDDPNPPLRRKSVKAHSRKSIGVRNLQNSERPPPSACITNAERYMFSLLITGANVISQNLIMSFLNVVVPSKTACYEAQPRICEELIARAYMSCAYWRQNMGDPCAISFDGSWSQRRRALHCFGAFVDPDQKKVVDFDVVERSQGTYAGNFNGTSQAMESEVLSRMGERWVGDPKIRWFCHDKDNHAMKILREDLHWPLEEKLDINHILKGLKRKFADMKMIQRDGKKKRENVLGDLEWHLIRWFYVVLRTDGTLEDKHRLWLGAYEHYVNPGEDQEFRWAHRDDERSRIQLRDFLAATLGEIELCQTEFGTQLNESLHAIKAKIADKTYAWRASWKARCAVAVLIVNEGHAWKLVLYDALGFPPLSPRCRKSIERYADRSDLVRTRHQDPKYHEAVRNSRREGKAAETRLAAAAQKARRPLHK